MQIWRKYFVPAGLTPIDWQSLALTGWSWFVGAWRLCLLVGLFWQPIYDTNLPPSAGPRSLMGMLAKCRGNARMDSNRWIAHLHHIEKEDTKKLVSLPPEVSSADVWLAKLHLSLWQDWKQLGSAFVLLLTATKNMTWLTKVKSIPASRAVTTAGARRFAPSKSILIRFDEFKRIEARHSETTFEM